MTQRYLVVGSETQDEQQGRRDEVGATSAHTFAETLQSAAPGCECDLYSPVQPAGKSVVLSSYAAVYLAGSPISLNEESDGARRSIEFMRAVFASGRPSFGSCAGLQIATVAAGGTTRTRRPNREAAFARRITATAGGAAHPMLAGRPAVWDALTLHSDEVDTLPDGAVLLASSRASWVQAAEIRHGGGVFWGVQYHPELTLVEIARSLSRDAAALVSEGLATSSQELSAHADRIAALGKEPARADLAWQLGIDEEILDPDRRLTELRNFIRFAAGG